MNLTPAKKRGEEDSNPIFMATKAVDHKKHARTARAVTVLKLCLFKFCSLNACVFKLTIQLVPLSFLIANLILVRSSKLEVVITAKRIRWKRLRKAL
jgi:hypothetical protein